MSAQRYADPTAHSRMAGGMCPECGNPPLSHSSDLRFWIPRTCDLRMDGVWDRIKQYREDQA